MLSQQNGFAQLSRRMRRPQAPQAAMSLPPVAEMLAAVDAALAARRAGAR